MNVRLPTPRLNTVQTLKQVGAAWDDDIVLQLTDSIAVPAKSPRFDTDDCTAVLR